MAGLPDTSTCDVLGEGALATSVPLCGAGGPADAAGNIYITDMGRIRRINIDGTLTTIAGNGLSGAAGDGGPALSASLGSIFQLALDRTGKKICFADGTFVKIRCVFLDTGLIQGYGIGGGEYFGGVGDGGNVANASFAAPMGVAFDDAGNLYIADFADARVRKVDAVTNVITTVVGPGPGYCCIANIGDGGPALGADLYAPMGLAYANGSLYISDTGNSRIRRVDLVSGIISTFAGGGALSGTNADGGAATAAGISNRNLAADNAGNLFFDDSTSVRMVDANGIITSIAGIPGISGDGEDDIPALQTVFGGIHSLNYDPIAKRLLIGDTGTRIRQIFFTPPTTITLSLPGTPPFPSQNVTLTATVAPSDATGVVRLHQGLTLLGSYPVVNGTATLPWVPSFAESVRLSAAYGGDATHNLSWSGRAVVNVQWLSTATSAGSNLNPSVLGQPITLTATVSPSNAPGLVLFSLGSMALGSVPVNGGVARLTTSGLPLGADSITATFQGSGSCCINSWYTLTQTVRSSTSTSLTSSLNPATFGNLVTLSAVLTPPSATGTIQFVNGATAVCQTALISGKAQCAISNLPAGSNSLTAVYGGDASNAPSTSPAIVENVSRANSSTSLTASPASPTGFGTLVKLTANLSPAVASGTVQFLDGSAVIGSAAVSSGTAVLSTSKLAVGAHTLKASYSGDSNLNASVSSTLSFRIKH